MYNIYIYMYKVCLYIYIYIRYVHIYIYIYTYFMHTQSYTYVFISCKRCTMQVSHICRTDEVLQYTDIPYRSHSIRQHFSALGSWRNIFWWVSIESIDAPKPSKNYPQILVRCIMLYLYIEFYLWGSKMGDPQTRGLSFNTKNGLSFGWLVVALL